PARRFEWSRRGHDDGSRFLWSARMEPAGDGVCGRVGGDTGRLPFGTRTRGRDPGAFDTRRCNSYDVSFVGDRFPDDVDGRYANSFVHVLVAGRSLRHNAAA